MLQTGYPFTIWIRKPLGPLSAHTQNRPNRMYENKLEGKIKPAIQWIAGFVEPPKGFEPMTWRLRNVCSTG